ncbi:MAG: methyltransferase domain-containing protein [Burkholderiales bacterium]|nr:methyltransferase domain-containing protein [Burkholderiales bacterium]
MATSAAFEQHTARYEAWFERHDAAYISELLALRPFVPLQGRGLEIGVGSGRFAAPLGIQMGIDPSPAMLAHARARGLDVIQAVAERLPFPDDSFDHVLVVTTLCFVDSPAATLAEARRVLRPGGTLVIGFIDRESPPGRDYQARKAESVFYRNATFHSAADVERLLLDARFSIRAWGQTLSRPLDPVQDIEPLRPGRGVCAFAVVQARNDKGDAARAASHVDR